MKQVKMLDCTLRDGGYVNDWEFGYDNLNSIFERLVSSNVDIIEIGFLDERREFDKNRSIMPDTKSVEKIYGRVNKRNAMIVGMIDYGTCEIDKLQPCSESYLDGIRVIFKKHIMHEAIAFAKQVKQLGYKVFTQAVSITSYSDEELMELIGLVNEAHPYAVSMVDTYGLLHQGKLMHYFELMNEHLLEDIGIGYHSHNNFQLAYANCIEMLSYPTERMLLVDGSLYGMGKSAGNAPIELLAMHLNECYGKNYDTSQLLEAIDCNIMRIYQKQPWGYNFFFYVAASNHCHPNYVQFLMDKHTLSVRSINEILDQIKDEKKLLYDQKYIENLYYEYQKYSCNDDEAKASLSELFDGKEILILGPGKTISSKKLLINSYIKRHNPVVIAINFIPKEIEQIEYVFLSNPRRYISLATALQDEGNENIQVIATSNVTRTKGVFSYTLNNSELLDQTAEFIDNSFVMLLKVLVDMPVKSIICAGLDGYSKAEGNYAISDMEYWFARRKANELNNYTKECLKRLREKKDIVFLTPTYYED